MSLTTKVKVAKISFLNENSYNKTLFYFNKVDIEVNNCIVLSFVMILEDAGKCIVLNIFYIRPTMSVHFA